MVKSRFQSSKTCGITMKGKIDTETNVTFANLHTRPLKENGFLKNHHESYENTAILNILAIPMSLTRSTAVS
jgi:hypothetical protein